MPTFFVAILDQVVAHRPPAFATADWRQRIVDDLVDEGSLNVVREFRDGKDASMFWVYGRRVTARVRLHPNRKDALEVLALADGPASGGSPAPPGKGVRLQGEFRLLQRGGAKKQPQGDALARFLPPPAKSGEKPHVPPPISPQPASSSTVPRGRETTETAITTPAGPSSQSSGGWPRRDPVPTPVVRTPAGVLQDGPRRSAAPPPEERVTSSVQATASHESAGRGFEAAASLGDPPSVHGGPSSDGAKLTDPTVRSPADAVSSVAPAVDLAPPAVVAALTSVAARVVDAPPVVVVAPAADWRALLIDAAVSADPERRSVLKAGAPMHELRRKRDALESQIRRLQDECDALPSEEDLEGLIGRVERTAMLAAAAQVSAVAAPRSDSAWRDLDVLLALMATKAWTLLPPWLFPDDPSTATGRQTIASGWEETLAALACVEWVRATFGDEPPAFLRTLPEPHEPGTTPVGRLEAGWLVWRGRSERMARLKDLRPVPAALDAPALVFEQLVARAESWRGLLTPSVFEALWGELETESAAAWLERTELPFDIQQLALPDVEMLRGQQTFDLARRILAILTIRDADLRTARTDPPERPGGPRPQAPVVGLVSLEHPVSNEDAHIFAPQLVLPRAPAGESTALLKIPVRLRAAAPVEGRVELLVESEHIKLLPVGPVAPGVDVVAAVDGNRALRWSLVLKGADWFEAESDGSRCWEGTLALPATAARLTMWGRGDALRLTISGTGVSAWSPRFADFVPSQGRFSFPIEDTTDSDTMIRTPLGIQADHQHLANIVRSGGKSFYIAAPRRFGKTTLMNYLLSVASEQPQRLAIEQRLLRNASPKECMRGLLVGLGQQIMERFGAAPPEVQIGTDGFPDRAGFDGLRQYLFQRGIRRLSIFVDEAQALVPRNDGGTWGDRLKTLIEGRYGIEGGDKASVSFVLVGTMALPDRLGRNCRDFMNVKAEITRIEPDSLARFIRENTGGRLVSSARARHELARAASNLWSLLRLLEEIAGVLDREDRCFFLVGDVRAAIERLIARESDNADGGLWSYVSAELSHTDQWDPIDAYPVALALARPEVAAKRAAERLPHCVEWLNRRLAIEEFPGLIHEERVRAGMTELERLGVLHRGGRSFERPLLEKLLARRAKDNPFADEQSFAALVRMAVDVVDWPANAIAKTDARGGQAEIFIVEDEERTQAWRRADVSHPEARRRFAMTCSVLRTLRESRTRTEGDDHLPRVRKAGFNVDNPNEGIIVYDWIPGQSMAASWGDLPELVRAHIVRQIAGALDALARRGIVHRDVTPRNVVVDGALRATLIDFGMACLVDNTGSTMIDDVRFVAPEVQRERRYSVQSDIFALGAILAGKLTGDRPANLDLQKLLQGMRAEEPGARPTASEVERTLAAILQRNGFDTHRYSAKLEVEALLGRIQEPWLRSALCEEQFLFGAVNRKMRWTPWNEARALEVAHLLNTVFGLWVAQRLPGESTTLAALSWEKGPSLSSLAHLIRTHRAPSANARWRDTAVGAVGQLRNAYAHPERREHFLKTLRQEFAVVGGQEATAYKKWVIDVGKRLDGAIGSNGAFAEFVGCFTET
jgi:serine/threonine protein kinase